MSKVTPVYGSPQKSNNQVVTYSINKAEEQ